MPKKKTTIKADTLERIEELLRVIARVVVSDKLSQVLEDKNYQTLYEGTGKLGIVELSKKTRFSTGKISGIWKEWEQLGIVVKDGKSYKKVI